MRSSRCPPPPARACRSRPSSPRPRWPTSCRRWRAWCTSWPPWPSRGACGASPGPRSGSSSSVCWSSARSPCWWPATSPMTPSGRHTAADMDSCHSCSRLSASCGCGTRGRVDSRMRLTVLGCSGSGPGPTSPASGYLVRAGDVQLTLDLGNGTFGALQRHLDPWALSAVVLSHLHPDHCSDFASLAVHRRYHPRPAYDPAGAAAARARAGRGAPPGSPPRTPPRAERAETDMTDIFDSPPSSDGENNEVAGMTLQSRAIDHPCEAYAVRVERRRPQHRLLRRHRPVRRAGRAGPGRRCPALRGDLADDTDWWEEPPRACTCPGGRRGARHQAGVGRLLLTHVAAGTTAGDPRGGEADLRRAGRAGRAGPQRGTTSERPRPLSWPGDKRRRPNRRRAPPRDDHSRLPEVPGRIGAGRVRRHEGACRERHRGRAALAQGLRTGLAHRRVRDAAAATNTRNDRESVKGRVGGRTTRSTGCRAGVAGLHRPRALGENTDRPRLRRPAGRRRHPHGGDHRRLRGAGRRRHLAGQRRAAFDPKPLSCRSRRSAWGSSTACAARPAVRGGLAGRGRHERRRDRHRQRDRGAGHRRGRRLHRARPSTPCWTRPSPDRRLTDLQAAPPYPVLP